MFNGKKGSWVFDFFERRPRLISLKLLNVYHHESRIHHFLFGTPSKQLHGL